ncbi:hypothetical protein SEA_LOZINAK_3 [Gordonia phage Lozinak]|uniref:Uncharacterized protein n=4 Tax=Smoothievirus TaxID=1982557 RepID=A0A2D1GFS7_9CAUD|nr:hypothetical protein BEN60_gp003 [Gordonia phage Smoothie]YP_009273046.1 hypothetical protein BH768_gp003 [Gordonia phage ClubL]YP_009281165.1 hypothetical protein BIZ74_gp003 [Gordonia phage Cucurbita]ATN90636.1 hypothetical protein SEA_LOZINAK_3 [Gordonia phage Lozinak]AUE23571.1 hypothetical protein SEA_TONIANN_3 [Gordonia phage Toniann]QAU06876.1 hypothetical protein SEA_APHELION_3 [Gordonia phage Aphelion]QKY79590.1 hypothetical protein SEA_ENGINEER_3 [Gordonia Phage Engineer]QYC5349
MRSAQQRAVIECQGCGIVLQELTEAQRAMVAENPHNYIGFCRPCKQAELHIEEQFS